jgi:hypothetical protein
MEGNMRRRWCTMMVVEAAVSGGDQPGQWWGVMRGGGCSDPFGSGRGSQGGSTRARTRGGCSGVGHSACGGLPGGACVSAREDGADWLGQPKAEAQWRVVVVAQWEGKGEWAGQGGRRSGPQLGQIRSRARIQKEILFKFQLILEIQGDLGGILAWDFS